MVAVIVLLLYLISICTVSGKIHRVHPHFHANFTIIDGSRRLTANCVRNTTVHRLHDCVGECVRDKRCATFNYHRYEGFCELLTLSKFDLEGILEHDDNYVHYETDDNERLYGPVCLATSPCKSYQVCEDTYECCARKYVCKCREGYRGKHCDVYKGYGSIKERPAPSCKLLLERFQKLPNGRYWIKSERSTKKLYCERYANGGFAPWSPFTPCSHTCGGGQQIRRRACKHPSPTSNGPQCIGEAEYSKACNQHACPVDGGWGGWTNTTCSLTCGNGTITKTRLCDTPSPSNGGLECLKSDGMTRDIVENIIAVCETQDCRDGGFSYWSQFSNCNSICGGGHQSRNRSCVNPRPMYGGRDCVGDRRETRECNTHMCQELALNKPSTQSSTGHWNGVTVTAKKANDGNMDTKSSTQNYASWWSVDLQKVFRINQIILFLKQDNYHQKCYKRVKIFSRKVLGDPWKLCKYVGKPAKLISNEIKCDQDTEGRYIKVSNNDKLALVEVKVYGLPSI